MKKLFAAVLAAVAVGAQAAPTLIDFAGLTEGNYPNPLTLGGVSFQTNGGGFNYVVVIDANTLGLCPSASATNALDCSNSLDVGFAGSASAISFGFNLNNSETVGTDVGDVQIYAGSTLLGTVDMLVADGLNTTLDTVALTGFSGVTRLLITSSDRGGLSYGRFAFDLTAPAVPEPGSLALVLGAVGLGVAAQRRRAQAH